MTSPLDPPESMFHDDRDCRCDDPNCPTRRAEDEARREDNEMEAHRGN